MKEYEIEVRFGDMKLGVVNTYANTRDEAIGEVQEEFKEVLHLIKETYAYDPSLVIMP